MEALMILLAFPLIWPFIAKKIWHTTINWQEMGLQIVIVTTVTAGVWQLGKYGATSDIEVWNGYVTAKDRDHGTYEQSYSCNCRTTSCGKNCSTQTCDTCYETHYTVTWAADTTVGDVTFDHKDSIWRSVYDSPNPSSYTNCKIGEPAAIEHSYTNYVQAVPQSLFHDDSKIAEQFTDNIPSYPRVHDFYRIQRVLNIGTQLSPTVVQTINDELGHALKTLGKEKQANIIVILTEIDDPTYRYAIENAWLGGNKNDIVLMIGLDGEKITWVDVMTWALNSGNELFHVTMRDGLLAMNNFNPTTFTPFVAKTVSELYDRPQMADYEYLESSVQPATWVIVLAVILAIGGSIGLTFFFHNVDVDFFKGNSYSRKRNRRPFDRYR